MIPFPGAAKTRNPGLGGIFFQLLFNLGFIR